MKLGEKTSVLVVDDDEVSLRNVADALAAAGYAVSTARDGADALRQVRDRKRRPELVVLDLEMPRMSGLEFLTRLRTSVSPAHLPVLVLSGHGERDRMVSCLERGANDFVAKPVDRVELVARVGSHLRTARAAWQWHREATEDTLTGLLNRRGLRELLMPELRLAIRYGDDLAVIFFDVNGFKEINDQLGHAQGDWVLAEVGGIIARAVRRTDLAARWGGDEFVLACPSLDRKGAERLIRSIQRQAARAIPIAGFSIAAGVATLAEQEPRGRSAAHLIDAADREMYRRKAEMKTKPEIHLARGTGTWKVR